MASPVRRQNAALIARLYAHPGLFDFFQAVRVLEASARESTGPAACTEPVGHDHAPEREVVRFLAVPSLAFAPTAIRDLRDPNSDRVDSLAARPPEMRVNFLGLVGTAGTLPQHYTELVLRRLQSRDTTLRDFFDLLHHRALSAFFRAWSKYRFPFAWEHERIAGAGDDLFTRGLYCLVGFGTQHLRDRQAVADDVLLFHGGHFAQRMRSASALERMLTGYFGFPIVVEQFIGRWLLVPEEERSRFPASKSIPDQRAQLGQGLMLGERVWDVQSKIRLHAGPLTRVQFTRMIPGGSGQKELRALLATYLGQGIDWDLEVVLSSDEAPPVHLGAPALAPFALGRNGWLRAVDSARKAELRALFSLDTP